MNWKKLKARALHLGATLEQEPENLSKLALLSAKFPALSPLNLLALHIQCPDAEYLRPAGDWMNERDVQIRSQQGIVHLYDAVSSSHFLRGDQEFPLSEATPEEQYKIQTGKLASKKRIFPVAQSYFDITQTKISPEGYPKYMQKPPLAAMPSEQQWQNLLLFAADMEFEVREKEFSSPLMRSRYRGESNRIELSADLPMNEKIPAFLHELATGILVRTSTETTVASIREFEIETLYAGLAHQCGYSVDRPFEENLQSVCRSMDIEKLDVGESFRRIGKANRFTIEGVQESSRALSRTAEQEKAPSVRENFLQEL